MQSAWPHSRALLLDSPHPQGPPSSALLPFPGTSQAGFLHGSYWVLFLPTQPPLPVHPQQVARELCNAHRVMLSTAPRSPPRRIKTNFLAGGEALSPLSPLLPTPLCPLSPPPKFSHHHGAPTPHILPPRALRGLLLCLGDLPLLPTPQSAGTRSLPQILSLPQACAALLQGSEQSPVSRGPHRPLRLPAE